MNSSQPMSGRTALVVGGTTGIGRATVLALARRGANVCFAGLGVVEGRAVKEDALRQGSPGAEFLEVDVRKEQEVSALIDFAASRFGKIDYGINNAGVETALAPVQDATMADYERVVGTNLMGMWLCMKYEIRHMLQNGGGAIVNTSSTAGVTGIAGVALYTASKHAIVGLTKAAALELAQSDIRVNAVAPGPVNTGLLTRMLDGKVSMDDIARLVPMGRISDPAEIAEAILWLVADASSYVTGHVLVVDGGLTAS